MPKYNLDALGHEEFERLCQSLVQQVIGPGAKVYGMGSDGAREADFKVRLHTLQKEKTGMAVGFFKQSFMISSRWVQKH